MQRDINQISTHAQSELPRKRGVQMLSSVPLIALILVTHAAADLTDCSSPATLECRRRCGICLREYFIFGTQNSDDAGVWLSDPSLERCRHTRTRTCRRPRRPKSPSCLPSRRRQQLRRRVRNVRAGSAVCHGLGGLLPRPDHGRDHV